MGYAKYHEDDKRLLDLRRELASWSELTPISKNRARNELKSLEERFERLTAKAKIVLEILTDPEAEKLEVLMSDLDERKNDISRLEKELDGQLSVTIKTTKELKLCRDKCRRLEQNEIQLVANRENLKRVLDDAKKARDLKSSELEKLERLIANSSRQKFSDMLDQ